MFCEGKIVLYGSGVYMYNNVKLARASRTISYCSLRDSEVQRDDKAKTTDNNEKMIKIAKF
jgi:hypothetical protein